MALVHDTLGRDRVREICRQAGLNSQDADTVDELLVRWEKLIGDSSAKLRVALELTGSNSNRQKMLEATLAICAEFAERQLADSSPNGSLS